MKRSMRLVALSALVTLVVGAQWGCQTTNPDGGDDSLRMGGVPISTDVGSVDGPAAGQPARQFTLSFYPEDPWSGDQFVTVLCHATGAGGQPVAVNTVLEGPTGTALFTYNNTFPSGTAKIEHTINVRSGLTSDHMLKFTLRVHPNKLDFDDYVGSDIARLSVKAPQPTGGGGVIERLNNPQDFSGPNRGGVPISTAVDPVPSPNAGSGSRSYTFTIRPTGGWAIEFVTIHCEVLVPAGGNVGDFLDGENAQTDTTYDTSMLSGPTGPIEHTVQIRDGVADQGEIAFSVRLHKVEGTHSTEHDVTTLVLPIEPAVVP